MLRYWRESPDDPETESVWVEAPQEYARNMPVPHRLVTGGSGLITCNRRPVLWETATVEKLRHFGPFKDACHSVDISSDSRFAGTSHRGADLCVWDIEPAPSTANSEAGSKHRENPLEGLRICRSASWRRYCGRRKKARAAIAATQRTETRKIAPDMA